MQTGNPASHKLYQGDIVVIAYLPPGKSIATIGDPPSVANLANALGAETSGASSATTMPATSPTTGSTTPTTVTPTTSKP